ncbi:hypothetical protein Q8W37_19295 [Shimia thalassica]|uniref:hypothetical protein n=1 Tax=Shimia thalassica TaxID=1715693 RepID=UPI0027375E8B|nr:hypothetical protein [Shimia thalassica]MDP2582093.1 hypothetical protein [Shimia thalassica]
MIGFSYLGLHPDTAIQISTIGRDKAKWTRSYRTVPTTFQIHPSVYCGLTVPQVSRAILELYSEGNLKMEILANRDTYGWEVLRQIDDLDEAEQRRFVDLDWFGVEVTWADDDALFAGRLDIKIWDNHCIGERDRKLLISPLRLRLEDEDFVADFSKQIEDAWDRARGLRSYDLGLDM